MGKKLKVNTGNAILLNNPPEYFSEYESIHINTGNALFSRKAYEKIMGMGISLNSGNTNIIDIEGDIVGIPSGTIINEKASYSGCFLVCDGDVVIENVNGLHDITGLYSSRIFHPENVDLSRVKGIISSKNVAYTNGAKLRLGNMIINEDSHLTLNSNSLYWIHGNITALYGNTLEKMQQKNITFHCKCLITYISLYEKYRDLFQADEVQLIPDGYKVSGNLYLDAGTSLLYGDKLYILGDLNILQNQSKYLSEFTSIIIKGTVTMPVAAASSFKVVGKADKYDLYEGVLREGNGKTIINHDMLQTAIECGISYSIRVNGELIFTDDITTQDIDAIASIGCNGKLIISGSARGVLDSKIKYMNGFIGSTDELDGKMESEVGTTYINTGNFKF